MTPREWRNALMQFPFSSPIDVTFSCRGMHTRSSVSYCNLLLIHACFYYTFCKYPFLICTVNIFHYSPLLFHFLQIFDFSQRTWYRAQNPGTYSLLHYMLQQLDTT